MSFPRLAWLAARAGAALPVLLSLALPVFPLLPAGEPAGAAAVDLPPPAELAMPLGRTLLERHSTRGFDPERSLELREISTLLWAAAGITRPDEKDPRGGKRTSPSAYGSRAVEVVVATARGVFRYRAKGHRLEPWPGAAGKDLRERLSVAPSLRKAPLLVVFVLRPERYPARVRPERRRDYGLADAAVMGENLYLASAALGLATVFTASAPKDAAAALGLEAPAEVLFVQPVGYPAH